MNQESQLTVLFADVSGSTKLYESEGDKAAMEAIARCIDLLRQTVETSGGHVVKTIGDEIMAVFPTPDAAANAASSMQYAIDALPIVGATKLGVRIGFHYGPVIQLDNDYFGDTVNLAARLVEQAARSQIIISRETSDRLGPIFRSFKRPLYPIHVRGRAEEVGLCELIWRHADDQTMSVSRLTGDRPEALALHLKFRDREIICRRNSEAIVIGRDPDCSLVIANSMASRKHCTVERRQDKFILADRSTNGTYVTDEGGSEVLLRREEFRLGIRGWITFGQPKAEAEEVVEYFCS
ncbi:MAG: adenylate/guanylate cyclase domain-containing protein [Burkholderiales bacterium]|nr:adenylate/guanylate cyclase domain-containing protein [Burkholderiales bacterium]